MPAKLEKTNTPGVFKRGSRYVVIYRDPEGRQRQESARNFQDAKRLRTQRSASVDGGTYQPQTRELFADYALAWVERYQGNGRRGFTEDTRNEYRRDLKRYAIPFLGRRRLEQVTAQHIAEFIAWLCSEDEQGRRDAEQQRAAKAIELGVSAATLPLEASTVYLADATVRRILSPVRACLRTATTEGLIRHNPTVGASLPARDEQQRISLDVDELEDDHDVRALTHEQVATLLAVAPPRHRLLFELVAATGVRISEALALRWGDLKLDGEAPVVRVRRAYVKGRFKPPKSKYGKRSVPVGFALVQSLRRAQSASEWPGERDLVFCTGKGTPLDYGNLNRRVLRPTVEEAGVPWAGFHTLRHTCATMLFAEGRNAVQVQRWLGHHSPAFTLNTYVHLLDDDLGGPLSAPLGCQQVSAQAPDMTRNTPQPEPSRMP